MSVPLALLPQASSTTGVTVLDLVLGAAVLTSVTLALTVRTRPNQAMAFLGMGVMMSVIWLRLGSVDVALAEAALGTGLLSALLVWLAVRSPRPPGAAADPPAHRWRSAALGIIAGSVTTVVTCAVWLRVEQQLPTWEPSLAEQLPAAGAEHEVTGVLLAFRAYDTLLESAVLMLAGIAVLALGQDRGLSQTLTPVQLVPSLLRWFVRLAAPVLLLFGLWLLFAGSSDSGGAFQSGAVLAGMLILLRTAHVEMTRFARHWLRPLLVIGVIVFIIAGMIGPLLGEAWLSWDPAWAFGAILIVEVCLSAGIAAGLYLLYVGLENPVYDTEREAEEAGR